MLIREKKDRCLGRSRPEVRRERQLMRDRRGYEMVEDSREPLVENILAKNWFLLFPFRPRPEPFVRSGR